MKYYLTFGSAHTHSCNGKTFDHNCVGVIEAETYGEARDRAFKVFGAKWAFIYAKKEFDFKSMYYYPRGLIEVN